MKYFCKYIKIELFIFYELFKNVNKIKIIFCFINFKNLKFKYFYSMGWTNLKLKPNNDIINIKNNVFEKNI